MMGIMSWEKLSREVRGRRIELGLTQKEVAAKGGPSPMTVREIEKNKAGRLSPRSRLALEQALDWESGSIDAILAGGVPTKVQAKPDDLAADVDRFSAAKRVLSLKTTFAKIRDGVEPAAQEALLAE